MLDLTPITAVELHDLARLETVIETGLATFCAVGRALAEIHSRELYRATHGTWEAYCTARWKFSKRHADRLMGAASVVADLLAVPKNGRDPVGPIVLPDSERVARPLVPLPAPARREVWQAAQALAGPDHAPTAGNVAAATRGARAQLEAVQEAEDRAAAAAAPLERPDDRTRRFHRIIKNLTKSWNAASHLEDESEREKWTRRLSADLAEARLDLDVKP